VIQQVPLTELSFEDDPQLQSPFLLQEPARGWVNENVLNSAANKANNARLACSYCVGAIKRHDKRAVLSESQSFARLMLPHANQCYKTLRHDLEKDSLDDVEWQVLGNLCMAQGAYSTAIGCFNLAIAKGPESISSVQRTQAALALATIYLEQDQLEESRQALESIEIHGLWELNPLLNFRVNFARAETSSFDENNLQEAVDKFDELERTQDKNFGPTDSRTLLVLHRLSSILTSQGKFERAEALYRRLLSSYRMTFGASEPSTLDVMEDLAEVLEHKGELDYAEELYEEAVNLKIATLGPDHPTTAASQARLATLYCRKYEFDKAETLYRNAELAL
jgi:tetratricopeptide (TPR) repeat protein